jgi:protein-tyrosine phosphatase
MKAEIYPIEIVPYGRLAIAPRPRAGDWLEGEVESWQNAGVNCVVSLLETSEVDDLALQQEPQLCRQSELEFLHFPIPDRDVPQSVEGFSSLVDLLVCRLRGGHSVVIHCRMGLGRSAVVAACVLAKLGLPVESAWKSIQGARRQSVPDTPEQRAWVTRYCTDVAIDVGDAILE